MTDKSEEKQREEFNALLQDLQITSSDSNVNVNEQYLEDRAMSKVKQSSSMNPLQERRKTICPDDNWTTMILPGSNVPEKILFVVDTARESDCTLFETRANAKFSPLNMIKRGIEIFVTAKLGLNPKHEFALMTLEALGASCVCDFTSNRKSFLSVLDKIEEDNLDEDIILYDLGPCFEKIASVVKLEDCSGTPTFVPRVILLYARSHCIPQFVTGEYYFDTLMQHKNFFLDCLYVHETVSGDNECQNIYTKLSTLDTQQTSYILEAGRAPATLHTNMAKLLAHPMQRARQDDSAYSFLMPGTPQEVQTNV